MQDDTHSTSLDEYQYYSDLLGWEIMPAEIADIKGVEEFDYVAQPKPF